MTVCALMLVSIAVGAAPQTQPLDSLMGKEASHGVYVRDSAIAVEKFALAQRMERLKEWDKAADALQEIVEKYSDRVIPSQVDQNNIIYQYTSVTTAVQERLARWPQEGLDAYRARFEPQAASMLQAADSDDLAALHRVISVYFVTASAKQAGIRLVDLYFESGEFPAAAWLADRLLSWHPTIETDGPRLLYRTALAYHLAGDAASAQSRLDELKQNHGDAVGTVRGQDVKLADSLAQELSTAPAVARGLSADSWPMVGGSPDRSRVPAAAGKPGAKIYEIEYARTQRDKRIPQHVARQVMLQNPSRADAHPNIGVMPVVDRGEMYFQDNARIYAVSLDSGVGLPGWAATWGDRNAQYVTPSATSLPQNQQLSLTVTDTSVLAIMNQIDRMAFLQGIIPPDRETRLVCLDRSSGKERWITSPRQLPETVAALRTMELGGSPLVIGDSVYVIGRGGKLAQFEDWYVLCFALKDGAFRWSCYIASGSGDPAAAAAGILHEDNIPHLAYASGRLYALSNIGALSAIDAHSGNIVWLNIYARPRPDVAQMRAGWNRRAGQSSTPRSWMQNPVIVKDGKVFILPGDAEHLFIYDAGNGVELKRVRLRDFDSASIVLGVVEEKLLLSSDDTVFCIDWNKYDSNKAVTENFIWKSVVPPPPQGEAIVGRGFVTSESVFIPTARGLNCMSLQGGKVNDVYPRNGQWDRDEGPGNVLVTQDHVIIATDDRVNVYTDLAVAKAKLDAEVAAAPNDPEPRLRYAEMLFVSGDPQTAVVKLDEAIALLGGRKSMRTGGSRDRVFNVALTFAQKLSVPRENVVVVPRMIGDLFDRAADAAATPAQQVNYRITRARHAETARDFAAVVRLYQQILSDPQLRNVPFADENELTQQAGAMAEQTIGKLVAAIGPELYTEFEQQASAQLAAARTSNDPARLMSLAQTYPNSRSAPEAMLAAAEAHEAAGQNRLATQVLNQIYRKYRDRIDRARVIEAQVRNYLQLPSGMSVAIGRLAEGAKLSGEPKLRKPLRLHDGTTIDNVSFAAALDVLRKHSAQAAATALPDLHLPIPAPRTRLQPFLPQRGQDIIADVDLLVAPMRDFARHDRIIAWTKDRGLSIFPVGETIAIGAPFNLRESPKGAAWIDKSLLIWSGSRIAMLADESGAVLWDTQLKSLPEAELLAGGEMQIEGEDRAGVIIEGQIVIHENQVIQLGGIRRGRGIVALNPAQQQPQAVEQIEHVRPLGDRALLCTSTGRIAAIDFASGRLIWQSRAGDGQVDQFVASDDFAVVRMTDSTGVQLISLDSFSGQILQRRVFGAQAGSPPVNMALSVDGTLVFTLADRICGKNLYEPGTKLTFESPKTGDGNPRYHGAGLPEQLVVADGRVLAVSENGMFVRVHSLENGKELSKPLAMRSNAGAVALRVVGSRLYVINQKTVTSYNLDRPEESWTGTTDSNTTNVQDHFIGKDYVVLLDQPGGRHQRGNTNRLLAYARYPAREGGAESGRFDYNPAFSEPAAISQWQAVNGGFYYRTEDGKLHFLRGAATAKQ